MRIVGNVKGQVFHFRHFFGQSTLLTPHFSPISWRGSSGQIYSLLSLTFHLGYVLRDQTIIGQNLRPIPTYLFFISPLIAEDRSSKQPLYFIISFQCLSTFSHCSYIVWVFKALQAHYYRWFCTLGTPDLIILFLSYF